MISRTISASFTRPDNTTAYAANDLVANSATNTSVVLMSWGFGDAAMWLRSITLKKSGAGVTNADFYLWLINDSAVTFSGGDNAALGFSSGLALTDVVAVLPISAEYTATGLGSVGHATFDAGLHGIPATSYGFLQAGAAYTPVAEEVFTIELRADPYL